MSCLNVQTRISIGVLAFLVISPATAADFAETARKAQAAYAAAQREWQIGLAELAVEQVPEFEAIAKAQRDLQVAYIERGTSRFEYLMVEDPSRIVLTEGLSPFINYHYCPVKSRIESAGWGHRVSFRGSRTAARPVKWAFSRKG